MTYILLYYNSEGNGFEVFESREYLIKFVEDFLRDDSFSIVDIYVGTKIEFKAKEKIKSITF